MRLSYCSNGMQFTARLTWSCFSITSNVVSLSSVVFLEDSHYRSIQQERCSVLLPFILYNKKIVFNICLQVPLSSNFHELLPRDFLNQKHELVNKYLGTFMNDSYIKEIRDVQALLKTMLQREGCSYSHRPLSETHYPLMARMDHRFGDCLSATSLENIYRPLVLYNVGLTTISKIIFQQETSFFSQCGHSDY